MHLSIVDHRSLEMATPPNEYDTDMATTTTSMTKDIINSNSKDVVHKTNDDVVGIEEKEEDDGDCSCPICLETMTRSERKIFPLPCTRCDFNFCSLCVENFCRAAEDDYQMASDGSRQVKITVSCPQCRSAYPLEDLEDTVLLLRSAHALADAIMTKVVVADSENNCVEETKDDPGGTTMKTRTTAHYKLTRDSELSASELAKKSEFVTEDIRTQLEEASLLYELAVAKSVVQRKDVDMIAANRAKAERDEARAMWQALLDQLPAEPDNICRCEYASHCDGSCGSRNSIEVVLQNVAAGSQSTTSQSPKKNTVVDETLFQGFDEFINRDERIYLTELFTDGEVRSVSQAALIMNGVRRLALTGKHKTSRVQQEKTMSKREVQQQIDHIDQMKVQFPLPNHMPGYFLIPTYSYREGYMTLKDKPWDGSMTPPQRSQRVFEQVYSRFYTKPKREELYPLNVATVQAVRGPIGRLGLRRDDIITHVDDDEWNGTAAELQEYIYDCHAKHPRNEISITVNANEETCQFLKIRSEMMQRRAREQKERRKQKALLQKSSSDSNSNSNSNARGGRR